MHVGIIGLVNIGIFHARVLRELSDVERMMVADLDQDRAKQLASELDATTVSTIDEVISAGATGIVIAT